MSEGSGEPVPYTSPEHAQYMEYRKDLVDAARESARSFDQAVLAFGAAAFGFSVAFLKDVAPHPAKYTLKWLITAWCLLACGLLAILLSFLFSHKACMTEVDFATEELFKKPEKRPPNKWSNFTDHSNWCCIFLLFTGVVFWSIFAVEKLAVKEASVDRKVVQQAYEDRGYIPPRTAPLPPAQAPPSGSTQTTPPKPER